MLAEHNIPKLHNYQVLDDIKSYFEELSQDGKEGTIVSYKGTIDEFFQIIFTDNSVELLTPQDICNLQKSDLINYRKILKEVKGNSNNTINKKIRSVKSLFTRQFAAVRGYEELNLNMFNIKALTDDSESYDKITPDEADRIINLIPSIEKNKGEEKQLFVTLAIRTSFRQSELLSLTWDDFEVNDNYVLVYVDKKNEKKNKDKENPITLNLYNRILKLRRDGDKVFSLTKNEIVGMMERINKKSKFLGTRKLVFHSFRSVAGEWDYERNKDIKRVSQQMHHANMNTDYKHYMNKQKDYLSMPGIMMEQTVDMSFIDEMTLEDFKAFMKISSSKVKNEIKKFYETEIRDR